MPEITAQQIIAKTGYKRGKPPIDNRKIRLMRKDPTISLARKLFFAGIIISEWQYEPANEDVPPERVEFIKNNFEPMRRHILQRATYGCFDYGWAPFEKVLDINSQGLMYLRKLKPLLQDLTEIVEDKETGAFLGFKQTKEIPLENSMLFNWDVEGTDYQGESTIAIAEQPYDNTLSLNDAAERYDKKMAGAHWVVRYPTQVVEFNGEKKPAHEAAKELLQSLQSSGSIAIPQTEDLGNEGNAGWQVELITANAAQFPFRERMAYLDALKVRALGFPERSILEGQLGTKAEAEAHADFVITLIEDRHLSIAEQLNWHCVNQILRLNWGEESENSVIIKPAPLNDSQRGMLIKVYDKILENADGFIREVESLDVQGIADTLGIPRVSADEIDNPLDVLPPGTQEYPQQLPTATTGPVAANAVAATSFTGPQMDGLLSFIKEVTAGTMSAETAKYAAYIAFPTVPRSDIDQVFNSITVKPGLQPTVSTSPTVEV